MENLEPKKERSPISSLKFQRKSDYKKFRNFIKKETKELKGIEAPKDNKLKSILKVGAGGLGFLALGGLIGAKGKGKGNKEGDNVFPFAIGRKNFSRTTKYSTAGLLSSRGGIEKPVVQGFYKGTRTRSDAERNYAEDARKNKLRQKKVISESEKIAKKVRKDRGIKKKLTENITRQKTKKTRLSKKALKTLGGQGVLTGSNTKGLELGDRPKSRYSDYGSRKRFSKPETSFPRSNVKSYGKMGIQQFFGAGRIGKVRPKPGFMIDPLSGDIIPTDPIEQIIREAKTDPNARKQFLKDTGLDDLSKRVSQSGDLPSEKFSRLRRGTRTFADFSPFKDAKSKGRSRVTSTVGRGTFPEKNFLGKLSRRFINKSKNTKITRDSFLGMTYKGKLGSVLGAASSNPLVKAGFFILDAYAAYQSGKSIINTKDNIGTALYDLGVSINNEIFKNDPSKLKLYVSESSDENFRVKQVIRNQRINQRKQQASSGNNVIVVPESKQNNQVTTNIPIKTGGTEVSFVPFEPLNNIGTDILLHKLNA